MDIGNLILGFLIGVIYFVLGVAMRIKPSHEGKGRYGYRSSQSMKNERFWNQGNSYSANLMMLMGIILILISVISSLWIQGVAGFFVIVAAVVLLAALMIVLVEGRLKKNQE
ncbi:hypothetical protein J23TS9_22790 [Paenibacillus sp. J23TS9]|uniref:SdpI family protein n=1 Tax=Paenibacillus sp. J23TS9 TaxID=2807193 RepID=UPI001B2BE890|nr:SdpI family protein [Paenibacillus sp. J23TS9]GIP27149.1 hypothetical protein J23TS9_22790 [Paenibacillus sp. J23TS9]